MFRVFNSKTRVTHTSRRSQNVYQAKQMVASLLLPVVVVVGVVVASYVQSGGRTIGYGETRCYLDSYLVNGVSLIGPLAAITLANITFFAVTVRRIDQVKKLQVTDSSKGDDSSNIYIYVKLSSMIGVFWVVSLMAEALNVDILRYIAIVLNGLQGMFIFLSYTFNRRVLNLYLHRSDVTSGDTPGTNLTSSTTKAKPDVTKT
ncbi:adhesion G protein-coupled receptor E5-like [Physella acuta]|uniref:adhesion G protein-coupled receptor E5-like n=1 Tax=Physella acuta TaxID=109671 RepID=UPI0027DD8DE5|nr:adhesion G protein-coupled receptor E5-like [Physella acuta]